MTRTEFAIPHHFDPQKTDQVWKVPYQGRAEEAKKWATQNKITPAANDKFKVSLLLVDVQNTFCIPGFELYVGGRSGTGAVDDNRRLCEFIYRNLGMITRVFPTMDTHQAMQIFHSIFFTNDSGQHPPPFTLISAEDIENGVWKMNPEVANTLSMEPADGQKFLQHYTRRLSAGAKYDLTIWPYHAMLGGIGHALVSAVEEAVFFHGVARYTQPDFQVKGSHTLTENYSAIKPEVMDDANGEQIAKKNSTLIELLLEYDAIFVAGQAKSHCVAWTIDDLLSDISAVDSRLAQKLFLMEDCTSPVVIPGVIDYTDQADKAFRRFMDAGMHIVRSTDPIQNLPGIDI